MNNSVKNSIVAVEIKYSSSKNLIKGFSIQLPTYNKAENAKVSIYLVLRTTKSEYSIKQLQLISQKAKDKGERVPEVIILDARPQKSASYRR